jgi:hypothetical protein
LHHSGSNRKNQRTNLVQNWPGTAISEEVNSQPGPP